MNAETLAKLVTELRAQAKSEQDFFNLVYTVIDEHGKHMEDYLDTTHSIEFDVAKIYIDTDVDVQAMSDNGVDVEDQWDAVIHNVIGCYVVIDGEKI